jgi:predicted NAD/FAD-dependent oxidoreductase
MSLNKNKNKNTKKNIAIIGAGICGLVCANYLSDNFNITLFEKSRGVSGRTSTRYADAFEFDHAAPYFTARTAEFQKFVQLLCDKHIITQWNPKIESLSLDKPCFKKLWFEPHYVGFSRMNDIAKYLTSTIADNHTIHLGTEIQSVQKNDAIITLTDKNNQIYTDFDYLVITAPAPQTFNLLPVDIGYRELLNTVTHSPAYSLMIGTHHKMVKKTSLYECDDAIIAKIIINSDKPNRNHAVTSIMVQSTPEWANTHIDADIPQMQNILLERVLTLLNLPDLATDFITTHRWRYARTQTPLTQQFLYDTDFNIGVCGDWCQTDGSDTQIQGVESAYLSANALAHYLLKETA